MSAEDKDQGAQVNYLDMSDEEMLNAAPPVQAAVEKEVVAEKPEVKPEVAAEVDPDLDAEDEEDKEEKPAAVKKPASEATDPAEDGAVKAPAKDEKVVEGKDPKKVEATDPKAEKPEVKEATEEKPVVIDFEKEYSRLMAPFKANNREVQVKSVEDAITLMQMGANYNKKMAGLKPNLKLMKLLENNGLLDETKLSFLIELDKKSPDAIQKLVSDSGLNPMDFDAEKAGEYKPKIHTVDDRELALDTALSDISDSASYNRTLKIVSKEWDGASKQVVAGNPQLLKVINDHVERGIYDQISAEVESERTFGRLNGLSDIEAYRQVGDAIQARGGFNQVGSSHGKPADEKPVVVAPKPKQDGDDKRDEKRRAASSTKPASPNKPAQDFNPLDLSDAEFEKLSADKFRK